MTDARGRLLQNALAEYLRAWWPSAESTGAGRQGSDVTGTPGVAWECKTVRDFARDFTPTSWINQVRRYADGALPLVVCFPGRIGAGRTGNAVVCVPLDVMMDLLVEAGYAPESQAELQKGM